MPASDHQGYASAARNKRDLRGDQEKVTVYHATAGTPVEVDKARAEDLIARGTHTTEPIDPATAVTGDTLIHVRNRADG